MKGKLFSQEAILIIIIIIMITLGIIIAIVIIIIIVIMPMLPVNSRPNSISIMSLAEPILSLHC